MDPLEKQVAILESKIKAYSCEEQEYKTKVATLRTLRDAHELLQKDHTALLKKHKGTEDQLTESERGRFVF